MAQDLTSQFLDSGVDHMELLALFQEHFNVARSTPNDHVEYMVGDKWAIRVGFKAGVITHIERGPILTDDSLGHLIDRAVTDLVESVGDSIAADCLFCSRPVRGKFRSSEDLIQLLPPPENAPQTRILNAEHPFVLEYRFARSKSAAVNHRRRLEERTRWAWILNAVLRPAIRFTEPRVRHFWALPIDDERSDRRPLHERVQWSQEFYMVEGFKAFREAFSQSDAADLVLRPWQTCYEGASSNELELRDNLNQIVRAYRALSPERGRRFLRSAQLVYAAGRLWDHSASTYYTTMVQAIEALAGRPSVSADQCRECGRDRSPGPTKRFELFVERFGPETAETKRELYGIRSALAHGDYLLQLDETPWHYVLNTSYLREQRGL